MSLRRVPVLCTLVLGLFACGSAPVEDLDLAGAKSDGGRCSPGDTQSCICLGGGQGTQTCRASGASFGPCTACATGMGDGGSVVIDKDMGGSPCGECDGCCDGASCVLFAAQTNGKCGGRGQACAMCTMGKICGVGTGECVTDAGGCGACSNGCCQNNICYQNQAAKCGTSCTQCTYGVTCVSGACTTQIDRNAYFKVYVKSIRLKEYDFNSDPSGGDYWDGTFANQTPEPQAKFYYQAGGSIYEGVSQYVDPTYNSGAKTYDATFDATTGLVKAGGNPFLVPGSALADGLVHAVAQDYDTGLTFGDDIAADVTLTASSTLMMTYTLPAKDSMVQMVFELK